MVGHKIPSLIKLLFFFGLIVSMCVLLTQCVEILHGLHGLCTGYCTGQRVGIVIDCWHARVERVFCIPIYIKTFYPHHAHTMCVFGIGNPSYVCEA